MSETFESTTDFGIGLPPHLSTDKIYDMMKRSYLGFDESPFVAKSFSDAVQMEDRFIDRTSALKKTLDWIKRSRCMQHGNEPSWQVIERRYYEADDEHYHDDSDEDVSSVITEENHYYSSKCAFGSTSSQDTDDIYTTLVMPKSYGVKNMRPAHFQWQTMFCPCCGNISRRYNLLMEDEDVAPNVWCRDEDHLDLAHKETMIALAIDLLKCWRASVNPNVRRHYMAHAVARLFTSRKAFDQTDAYSRYVDKLGIEYHMW
jgi:hypothetical protein